MEIERQRVNIEQYTLTFQNDLDSGMNELEIFMNVVNKWHTETKRAGFKKLFNSDEVGLINQLHEAFKMSNTQQGQSSNITGTTIIDVNDGE